MMTQDMGSVLQQALQQRGGANNAPAAPQEMAPTQTDVMGGGIVGGEENFQIEEIAEQLAAVEQLMESIVDPNELQQMKTVADQLRMALEAASAALPQGVEGSPDPSMGVAPPMAPVVGGF